MENPLWSAAMGTTYYTNDPFGNLTRIAYPHSGNVTLQVRFAQPVDKHGGRFRNHGV